MKNNTQNNLTKVIVTTILKTLGVILVGVSFFIVSFSVVAPKTTLRILDNIGFDRAGYLVQKRLYARDPSLENLYNQIQRSIEMENYEDQAKYIEIMINEADYTQFCDNVDKATRRLLGERYSIYADSYDTYLRRHLVVALYNTDRELEAKMMAIDSVYGSLDELYVYVCMVANDSNLTDFQKQLEITTLYTRYSILDALETKLLELDEMLGLSETAYNSIIVLEQKVKLAEIQKTIGEYCGDNSLFVQGETNIKNWTDEIKILIEALN